MNDECAKSAVSSQTSAESVSAVYGRRQRSAHDSRRQCDEYSGDGFADTEVRGTGDRQT